MHAPLTVVHAARAGRTAGADLQYLRCICRCARGRTGAPRVGVYLVKLAGMSVPLAVLQRPRVQRLAALLPVVLLAALIGVQTFGSGQAVSVDARFAGVLVAAVAVWRKVPFLLVVATAVAVTALARHVLPGS